MAKRQSRLHEVRSKVLEHFLNERHIIYKYSDLAKILVENRSRWGLPVMASVREFINFLKKEGKLREINLLPERLIGLPLTRYAWGSTSPFLIALSVKPKSYFCHATALYLHAITKQVPKMYYVNYEQRPKDSLSGHLTQDAINRAFKNKQRQS